MASWRSRSRSVVTAAMCAPALSPPISRRSEAAPSSAPPVLEDPQRHRLAVVVAGGPLVLGRHAVLGADDRQVACLRHLPVGRSLLRRLPIMNAPPWIERYTASTVGGTNTRTGSRRRGPAPCVRPPRRRGPGRRSRPAPSSSGSAVTRSRRGRSSTANSSAARGAMAAFSARTSSTSGSRSGIDQLHRHLWFVPERPSLEARMCTSTAGCSGAGVSDDPSDPAATLSAPVGDDVQGGHMRGIVYDGESSAARRQPRGACARSPRGDRRDPGRRHVPQRPLLHLRASTRGRSPRCAGTRAPGSSPRSARRSPTCSRATT